MARHAEYGQHKQIGLRDAAVLWPTPTTSDQNIYAKSPERRTDTDTGRKQQICLNDYAQLWPTPSARDFRDGRCSEETASANSRPLNEFAVTLWATPSVSMCKGGTPQDSNGKRDLRLDIQAFPSSLPAPPTATPGETSLPAILALNPQFVDWLMGLPIGWTGSGPAEIPYALYRRRMLSSLSAMRSAIEEREASTSVQTSLADFLGFD